MEDEKQKLIRTVGTAIMAFSGMVILANGLGAVVWVLIMPDTGDLTADVPQAALWPIRYYVEMCLILVLVGAIYLFGGFYIRKFKSWANKTITILSVVVILTILTMAISNFLSTPHRPGLNVPNFVMPMVALFWCTPFLLLIWFLNRKDIARYFSVDQAI